MKKPKWFEPLRVFLQVLFGAVIIAGGISLIMLFYIVAVYVALLLYFK
jgi:hypothetical protein